MKNKIIVIYCPCKNKKEAQRLSASILKNKLAACSNSYPIISNYIWNEKLNKETEIALIFKTLNSKTKKLIQFLKSEHSYECPCIIQYEVKVNYEYLKWMKEVLK